MAISFTACLYCPSCLLFMTCDWQLKTKAQVSLNSCLPQWPCWYTPHSPPPSLLSPRRISHLKQRHTQATLVFTLLRFYSKILSTIYIPLYYHTFNSWSPGTFSFETTEHQRTLLRLSSLSVNLSKLKHSFSFSVLLRVSWGHLFVSLGLDIFWYPKFAGWRLF